MKPSQTLLLGLVLALAACRVQARPGTLENNDYKVTLSETQPGLDDQNNLSLDAAVTVDAVDKFRSLTTRYTLKVYAINEYFLLGDTLNVIGRTTPKSSGQKPLFDFIQLNLSNSADSRQFKDLKQYSFAPDNQSLLGVFDGKGGVDSIGLLRLSRPPARLGWIYAESAGVNRLQAVFPAPVQGLVLADAVGWSADSLSAALILTVDDGTKDAQGKPILKDLLADAEISDDTLKVTARAVDMSPYHLHDGGVITKISYGGAKATLFFSQANSSETSQADFPLPSATPQP